MRNSIISASFFPVRFKIGFLKKKIFILKKRNKNFKNTTIKTATKFKTFRIIIC
jgi:hypothetical protein